MSRNVQKKITTVDKMWSLLRILTGISVRGAICEKMQNLTSFQKTDWFFLGRLHLRELEGKYCQNGSFQTNAS